MRPRVLGLTTLVCFLSIYSSVFSQESSDAKDTVLAEVNGTPLTQSQLEDKINTFPAPLQATYRGQKPLLLEDMVNQLLLLQEAQKRHLEKDERVQRSFEVLKQNIMVQRMLELEVLEKVKTSPGDVKDFYEKNKADFTIPETIHPFHILLADEAKAKEAQARLNKGEDFAQVAKEMSVCPSAPRGGDLGVVRKGQMVPEFEAAASKLKLNEVSPIVKTQFGYHLIKVVERQPAQERAFDEISQEVENRLLDQKRREALKGYLQELKDQGQVKLYPEKIK